METIQEVEDCPRKLNIHGRVYVKVNLEVTWKNVSKKKSQSSDLGQPSWVNGYTNEKCVRSGTTLV